MDVSYVLQSGGEGMGDEEVGGIVRRQQVGR